MLEPIWALITRLRAWSEMSNSYVFVVDCKSFRIKACPECTFLCILFIESLSRFLNQSVFELIWRSREGLSVWLKDNSWMTTLVSCTHYYICPNPIFLQGASVRGFCQTDLLDNYYLRTTLNMMDLYGYSIYISIVLDAHSRAYKSTTCWWTSS